MRAFQKTLVQAVLAAVSVLGPVALSAADRDPDLIRRENARPGARDWQLTRVALLSSSGVRAHGGR